MCIYHVKEQILRKKFEISCNLSLDAMEVSEQWGLRTRLWASQARDGAGRGCGLSTGGGQLAPPVCFWGKCPGYFLKACASPMFTPSGAPGSPSKVESEDPTALVAAGTPAPQHQAVREGLPWNWLVAVSSEGPCVLCGSRQGWGFLQCCAHERTWGGRPPTPPLTARCLGFCSSRNF